MSGTGILIVVDGNVIDVEQQGAYWVVNAGGQTKTDITRCTANFTESDKHPISVQHRKLDEFERLTGVGTTARVETKKSVHAYFKLNPYAECSLVDWEKIQKGLRNHFDGDNLIDANRVMRLPDFDHTTLVDDNADTGEYRIERKRVECVQLDESAVYTPTQLIEALELVGASFEDRKTENKSDETKLVAKNTSSAYVSDFLASNEVMFEENSSNIPGFNGRDDLVYKLASYCVGLGMREDVAETFIQRLNEERIDPSFPVSVITDKVERAYKEYQPND